MARAPVGLGLLLLLLAPLAPACRGRRLLTGEPPRPRPSASRPADAPAAVAPPAPVPLDPHWAGRPQPGRRGGQVSLSAQDLASVDAFLDERNAQWILGDDVLVEASREYFGAQLSVNVRTGTVSRTDDVRLDETVITLTYLLGRMQRAAENNPRVMLGTGLTVTARRTLRVRLFKTVDPSVPVALRIVATGDASRGRREQVAARAPVLQVGGTLRRGTGGWGWFPFGS